MWPPAVVAVAGLSVLAALEWLDDQSGWIVAAAAAATSVALWLRTIWPKTRTSIAAAWRRWMQWRDDRRDLQQLIAQSDRLLKAVGENGGKSLHHRISDMEDRFDAYERRHADEHTDLAIRLDRIDPRNGDGGGDG